MKPTFVEILCFFLGLIIGLDLAVFITTAEAQVKVSAGAVVVSNPQNIYTGCVQECKNLYLK